MVAAKLKRNNLLYQLIIWEILYHITFFKYLRLNNCNRYRSRIGPSQSKNLSRKLCAVCSAGLLHCWCKEVRIPVVEINGETGLVKIMRFFSNPHGPFDPCNQQLTTIMSVYYSIISSYQYNSTNNHHKYVFFVFMYPNFCKEIVLFRILYLKSSFTGLKLLSRSYRQKWCNLLYQFLVEIQRIIIVL